jgi:hypothetical protein
MTCIAKVQYMEYDLYIVENYKIPVKPFNFKNAVACYKMCTL